MPVAIPTDLPRWAALLPWQHDTYYTAGERSTNVGNIYKCITPGVTAGSGGPSTTDPDTPDNEAHWQYIGVNAPAWSGPGTTYTQGGRVTHDGNIYLALSETGLSGSDGPSGTA